MNNKVKIIIAFVIVTGMTMVGWYFLRDSHVSKIEIVGDEQQLAQTAEKGVEPSQGSISDDNSSASRLNLENEATDSIDSDFEKEPIIKVDTIKDVAKPVASSSKLKIVHKLLNSGFQTSNDRKIDTIVIHSSYDALGDDQFSTEGIIQEYLAYGVSAHYLIGRDGTIYQLVQEKNIAYHAGVSSVPDGRTGVNAFSIGIELVNTKTDQMTTQQYVALQSLISDMKSRYEIKYVLGHNQIAPGRKDDPWNFVWNKLK
ncbi:MAG: N-acetylmuramyl-L-alanine amidase, negative regulator of AmpC, AmpD [Candidatus Moranbacteria bacterium GW2011_GWA2_39_41]|nr:MAG: N-acetylmuramyl-L-alanine amidase, negative regulator of AmpC, AmpD [Candidatus Moranbacteria bacterium GW2011_GWA2_39_41]